MLGLLGTLEPYPYFPRGDVRCNPDQGKGSAKWSGDRRVLSVETAEGVCARTCTLPNTHIEVHVLNMTHFSLCYLVV